MVKSLFFKKWIWEKGIITHPVTIEDFEQDLNDLIKTTRNNTIDDCKKQIKNTYITFNDERDTMIEKLNKLI